jgi:hypothetical protein
MKALALFSDGRSIAGISRPSLGALAAGAWAVLVLAALSAWGGSARPGPLLAIGIALMSSSIAVFAVLAWWLFLSPLPAARARRAQPTSGADVQRVAVFAAIGGLGTQVAAFWDDDWHRRFGGFGNDFLWPPHLLIYLSLGFIAACGIGSLVLTLRGRGGVRRRFRAMPAISITGLVAGFMVVLLPSDAIWHQIYGLDITAWSPPHLLAAVNFSLVLLAAAGAQLSLLPAGNWRTLRGISRQELAALVILALATLELLQIGLTEWDGQDVLQRTAGPGFAVAFAARPAWLYPVVVASIALFVGQLSIWSVRRAGVATLVAVAVLAFRVAALAAFNGWAPDVGMGFVSQLLLVPTLLVLDLWYVLRLERAERPSSLVVSSALAGGVCILTAVAAGWMWMPSPHIGLDALPVALFVGVLLSIAAGNAGARLGGWLTTWQRVLPAN